MSFLNVRLYFEYICLELSLSCILLKMSDSFKIVIKMAIIKIINWTVLLHPSINDMMYSQWPIGE